MAEQLWKIFVERLHRHYGGTVYKDDFYSAEYYNPKKHLKHFIEDLDWERKMIKNKLASEEDDMIE